MVGASRGAVVASVALPAGIAPCAAENESPNRVAAFRVLFQRRQVSAGAATWTSGWVSFLLPSNSNFLNQGIKGDLQRNSESIVPLLRRKAGTDTL